MKVIWILVALGVLHTLCSKEEWSGYLYPNRHDLTTHIETGVYKTIEECRSSILNHPRYSRENSDYECGLNCKPDMGLNVCKETAR